MFLLNEGAMFWILFIVLALVALFPFIPLLIMAKNPRDEKYYRVLKWAIRAVISDVVCLGLFIFLPDLRTKIVILLVVLIVLNGVLFKSKLL